MEGSPSAIISRDLNEISTMNQYCTDILDATADGSPIQQEQPGTAELSL
jgi:hypothetical protein